MDKQFAELLIRIAHLSEKLRSVSEELDKIYKCVGETLKIDIISTADE